MENTLKLLGRDSFENSIDTEISWDENQNGLLFRPDCGDTKKKRTRGVSNSLGQFKDINYYQYNCDINDWDLIRSEKEYKHHGKL